MRANEFLNEATGLDWNYGDKISSEVSDIIPELPADFNPSIAGRKIQLLKQELQRMGGANTPARAKIVAEIRKLENMISLHTAHIQSQPGHGSTTVEPDEGAPYMIYTDVVQAGQFAAKTLKGAKNAGQRAVVQQKANTYIIVTDNKNKIVFVWYPRDHENKYKVGGTYRPPRPGSWQGDTHSPRYPEGHPHAGAVMPPNVPIVTDWSKLEPKPTASASQTPPERYMGQAQRVDQAGGLPRPSKRRR